MKKKINSILASFRRERQKESVAKTSGSGYNDVYPSTWFAFEHHTLFLPFFFESPAITTTQAVTIALYSSDIALETRNIDECECSFTFKHLQTTKRKHMSKSN
nr:unnamed protein product [Callosobruchus chinensis]